MAWQPVNVDTADDDRYYFADPAEVTDAFIALLELVRRPAWQRQAACRGQGPALWFPDRGQSSGPGIAICETCPVREPCRDYALRDPHTDGTWAGTSKATRRAMRKAA